MRAGKIGRQRDGIGRRIVTAIRAMGRVRYPAAGFDRFRLNCRAQPRLLLPCNLPRADEPPYLNAARLKARRLASAGRHPYLPLHITSYLLFGETGMGWRAYLRMRHLLSVSVAAIFICLAIASNDKTHQFYLAIVLCFIGFSLYFERCRNCQWPIWVGRGLGGFLFYRFIGPFYLPSKCAHCGSPDFETPPSEL